jgi:hypothetical protein
MKASKLSRREFATASAACLATGLAQVTAATKSEVTSERPLYLNPQVPVEQRVTDLLSRMTLEEKIAQTQAFNKKNLITDEQGKFSPEKAKDILHLGVGEITRASERRKPKEAAMLTNGHGAQGRTPVVATPSRAKSTIDCKVDFRDRLLLPVTSCREAHINDRIEGPECKSGGDPSQEAKKPGAMRASRL